MVIHPAKEIQTWEDISGDDHPQTGKITHALTEFTHTYGSKRAKQAIWGQQISLMPKSFGKERPSNGKDLFQSHRETTIYIYIYICICIHL